MTLLHMNGFEGAVKSDMSIAGAVDYVAGRTGRALRLPNSSPLPTWTLGAQNKEVIIVGFAFYYTVTNGNAFPLRVASSTGYELSLGWANGSNGTLTLYRGNGTSNPIAVSDSPLPSGTWNYIEAKVRLHQTDGFVVVRFNGVTVINYAGDTLQFGTVSPIPIASITGHNYVSGAECLVDDMYMCDNVDATATQGRPFNDFLGPVKIEPLLPSGNGALNEFVGSDGNSTDNYLLVDEPGVPNTTDYVETSTPGKQDLYEFANTTSVDGVVYAVDVTSYATDVSGGGAKAKSVVRDTDGTKVVGPGRAALTTYTNVSDGPITKDAKGNIWTVAKLNSSQFGVESG